MNTKKKKSFYLGLLGWGIEEVELGGSLSLKGILSISGRKNYNRGGSISMPGLRGDKISRVGLGIKGGVETQNDTMYCA